MERNKEQKQTHVNTANWPLTKEQKECSGEVVFSTSGAGTTEYPQAKSIYRHTHTDLITIQKLTQNASQT